MMLRLISERFGGTNRKALFAGLALLLAVVTFCSAVLYLTDPKAASAAPAHQDGKTRHKKYYDGNTLFEGFFFGKGDVAKLFPKLRNDTPAASMYGEKPGTAEANAVEDKLLKKVDESDPSFLNKFQNELYSGDRARIQKAFEEGSWKLASAIGKDRGVSAAEVRQGKLIKRNNSAAAQPQDFYQVQANYQFVDNIQYYDTLYGFFEGVFAEYAAVLDQQVFVTREQDSDYAGSCPVPASSPSRSAKPAPNGSATSDQYQYCDTASAETQASSQKDDRRQDRIIIDRFINEVKTKLGT